MYAIPITSTKRASLRPCKLLQGELPQAPRCYTSPYTFRNLYRTIVIEAKKEEPNGKRMNEKYKHERVTCGVCKKVFPAYLADIKRNKAKWCSRDCARISQTEKKAQAVCSACGVTFFRKKYKLHKGKIYCTQSCFTKNASAFLNMKGKNHPLWKGGYASTTIDGHHRKWKRKVLERDGYKCVYCGSTERLEADHLWPSARAPHLRYEVENGQTLCHKCHKKTCTYGSKNIRLYRLLIPEKLTLDNLEYSPEMILKVKRQVQKEFPELCS